MNDLFLIHVTKRQTFVKSKPVKMLPRYIFHKESKEHLKEFLIAAAELQKDNPDNCSLITTYLNELKSPQQQTSEDLNQSETAETDDVIIIDSPPATQTQKPMENEITQQIIEPDHFNCSTTAELIENIAENLRMETYNCENDIKKLATTCSEEQIENFILQIREELDVSAICNFGMALCGCENEDVNVIFLLFFKHILFPLLNSEKSVDFQGMFNRVYKKFHSSVINGDIVKNLLQTSSAGVFLENISKIDGELKSEIIRDLTMTCKRLEQTHVKVLDCLLDKNIHHSAIKEIITLLASQGETNDNATGKLIVSVLQILGRNIYQFEQPLRQIIAKHKSVWKTKLQKTFDLNYQCSQLSQTLIKH